MDHPTGKAPLDYYGLDYRRMKRDELVYYCESHMQTIKTLRQQNHILHMVLKNWEIQLKKQEARLRPRTV